MSKRPSNKINGTIAELQTTAELLRRGFVVSIPEGDYVGYDLIADNGKGKLCRIQVKSTNTKQPDSTGYRMNVGRGNSSKKPYTIADCDFIVCVACGAYYIIPVEVGNSPTITVYPEGPSELNLPANYKGRWVQYKARWDLLD